MQFVVTLWLLFSGYEIYNMTKNVWNFDNFEDSLSETMEEFEGFSLTYNQISTFLLITNMIRFSVPLLLCVNFNYTLLYISFLLTFLINMETILDIIGDFDFGILTMLSFKAKYMTYYIIYLLTFFVYIYFIPLIV